jgi:hypothetical protein
MRIFNLRRVTSPILLHLLDGEVSSPRLFMLRCALTLDRFKRRIDPRFPKELVDMAALPIWVYLNLKARVGQGKAFEILRVAILTGGVAQWNLAYETVDKERTFANLCEQELLVNRTGPTRWNKLEVVDRSEHRFEIRITCCLYHELALDQVRHAGFAPEPRPRREPVDEHAIAALCIRRRLPRSRGVRRGSVARTSCASSSGQRGDDRVQGEVRELARADAARRRLPLGAKRRARRRARVGDPQLLD